MRKLIPVCLFICLQFHLQANIVHQQLYLNRGTLTTVNNAVFPFLSFNETSAYDSLSKVICITTSDTLVFHVHNNDSITHAFAVKGVNTIGGVINAGDSLSDSLTSSAERIFIYYDSLSNPSFRYLGAAGMICVSNSLTSKNFYWNVKEHERSYNQQIAVGNSVSWTNYAPDYFTINSLSYPAVMSDTLSHITAHVGDTIRLFIANTGQSIHSLHFHGFHGKVLFSTSPRIGTGWIKDTFPLKSMEGVVIEFVPDKTGQYGVHDHNETAVAAGGTFPFGMMTVIDIQ